jgi:hypothetical protein
VKQQPPEEWLAQSLPKKFLMLTMRYGNPANYGRSDKWVLLAEALTTITAMGLYLIVVPIRCLFAPFTAIWKLRSTDRQCHEAMKRNAESKQRAEAARKRLVDSLMEGEPFVPQPGSAAASYGSKPREIGDL